MKFIFVGSFVVVLLWMVMDTVMRPGVNDLEGNFTKLAAVRNEQNIGPVIRAYAVTVKDTLWSNMLKYGNYMPHNKYGNTKVYFFLNNTPAPNQLTLGKDNIEADHRQHCIGLYEKNAMSEVNFIKYPFSAKAQ